jgi:cyclohexanone monooxygenase
VWYWNKYPGCRCDVASVHYSYGFSSELEQEWTWSEKFAAQPEILRYAYHVADKFKLRESFKFNSPVTKAVWDEKEKRWMVETPGENVTANFVVLCTGSLSGENNPFALDVKKFQGEAWHSSSYPETATVAGKRIAVVGTGCTGIQVVPTVVAKGAKSVTVFQRTAEWTTPSGNRKLTEEELKEIKAKYPEIRTKNYSSPFCKGCF